MMASADDRGTIVLHDVHENYDTLHTIKAEDEYPVTDMVMTQELVIASYCTGHLRFFNVDTGNITIEISAHCRCINAIDLKGNKLVSIGEDTFLNVWKLPDMDSKSSSAVSLMYSHQVTDHLLTGVTFLSNGHIVTSTYEAQALLLWALSEA